MYSTEASGLAHDSQVKHIRKVLHIQSVKMHKVVLKTI